MSCEDDYIHQQTNNNLRELRKKSTERRQASLLDTRYACGINESLRPNRNDEKTKEARNRERGYHRKNPKRQEKLRTFKSQDEPETIMTRTYQIGNSQDQKCPAEELATINAASHKALVNKRGTYQQKKLKINHNLNASLLAPAKTAMDAAFRNVLDTAPAALKAQMAQTIKTVINDLNKQLKDDPQALAGDAYQLCFGKNRVGYEEEVTLKVENARKDLHQGLIAIKEKAVKPGDKGYLFKAMDEIYGAALDERPGKGKKLKDVRHAYLEENVIGLDGPFAAIAEGVEEDVKKLIKNTCDKLRKEVVEMLKTIRAAFQRQKNRKEQDTPEGQQFRKELHELVDEARRILEGVVTKSLEKCKENK